MQPRSATNHFELFELPVRFTLDRSLFEKRYLHLARETHPDFAGEDEQLEAMELSARVNEAYAVLGDDLQRAEYLLKLRGGTLPASLDPAAMGQVFDLREAVSIAAAAGDEEAREQAMAEARGQFEKTLSELGVALDRGGAGEDVARQILLARYLARVVAH